MSQKRQEFASIYRRYPYTVGRSKDCGLYAANVEVLREPRGAGFHGRDTGMLTDQWRNPQRLAADSMSRG